MKKILAAALALSLLFAWHVTAYAEAGWPTYSAASNVSAARGATITVPITVSNNPGFTSVGFAVTYNPAVLELTGVSSATTSMPLNSQFALTSTQGTQWIHLINTNLVDWSGSGTLVNMTFRVKSDAALGTSPVYLAFTTSPDGTPANSNGEVIKDARVSSGNVTVTDTGDEETKYPVTYDLNGGTGIAPIEPDKAAGERFQAASINTINPPAGKQFVHWNTSPRDTGEWYWPGETIIMIEAPLTLYAIWEDIPAEQTPTPTPTPDVTATPAPDGSGNGMDVSNLSTGPGNTNSGSLPQAGALFLPIPLLAVFGGLMLVCGVLLNKKK